MVIVMQCGKCKNNLKWFIPEEDDTIPAHKIMGFYYCDAYPLRIPDDIENAIEDCPNFKRRKG